MIQHNSLLLPNHKFKTLASQYTKSYSDQILNLFTLKGKKCQNSTWLETRNVSTY